jgi:AcrR family transcriptional regulator
MRSFLENGHLFDFECRLIPVRLQNGKGPYVRYRTSARALSESHGQTDVRIQRTRALLHEALGALMREKPYDRITVADILGRARVSRSTFYIHFRDKDDLLTSSMREMLCGALAADGGAAREPAGRTAAFSLPLLTHIQQHRRSAKSALGERGRAILHQHLRQVLSEWIAKTMGEEEFQRRSSRRAPVPADLLAQHIASTFVLVLHWWLDHNATASPAEADRLFRALVIPVLESAPV